LTTACEHPPWSAARMTSTLAAYYERKRRELGSAFQGYYDDSLKRLFTPNHDDASNNKASTLLRRHRRELIDYVSLLTGHRKFDMHQLIKRLITRCDALDLYPKTNEAQSLIGLTALLTAIASNTLRVKRKHRHR
jgi:hypothetical protein